MKRLSVRAAIALLAITVTSVLFIDFCNLVYQCGCKSLWAGAAEHCNIHHGPKRCPWCAIGWNGYIAVWLWIVLPQAAAALWPGSWGEARRLVVSLALFPAMGGVAAAAVGIWRGYWN